MLLTFLFAAADGVEPIDYSFSSSVLFFIIKVMACYVFFLILLRICDRRLEIDFPKIEKEVDEEEEIRMSHNKDVKVLQKMKEVYPYLKIFSAPDETIDSYEYHDNILFTEREGIIYANDIPIWSEGRFTDWELDREGNIIIEMENFVTVIPHNPLWEDHKEPELKEIEYQNGDDGGYVHEIVPSSPK